MHATLLGRTFPLAALALLVAGATLLMAEPAEAGAVIDNGVIQIGVTDSGALNEPGPGTPASCGGAARVGLRYMPTGCDATAPGCYCEGWGVSYNSTTPATAEAGWANNGGFMYATPGSSHTMTWFWSNPTEAIASTDLNGNLNVTHHYLPYSGSSNVYVAEVQIENLAPHTLTDIFYRRAMDWDIQPTAFSEHVTIGGSTPMPTALVNSGDNGFASTNPLDAGWLTISCPLTAYFTDCGPNDHGAVFTFNLGDLGPGQSHFFYIYYGAASNEADAMNILTTVIGAELYSMGQTSSDPFGGTPNTFFFAFTGLQPLPTADFGFLPGLPCHDDVVTFTDLSLPGSAKFPLKNATWRFGDGTTVGPVAPGTLMKHKYTPPVGTSAPWSYTVNLTVWDTNSKVAYREKTVTVCNEPPEIDAGGDRFVVAGHSLVFHVHVTDPNGDPSKLSLIPGTLPPGADFFEGVPGTWTFFWSPDDPDDVGVYAVDFVAEETTYGLTDTASLEIEVLPHTPPPAAAPDSDRDGIPDTEDNCPYDFNPRQDQEGVGAPCSEVPAGGGGEQAVRVGPGEDPLPDRDRDGTPDAEDVCPDRPDDQADLDGDAVGDVCDEDADGDGVPDAADNCLRIHNAGQEDSDGDGLGDACDGLLEDMDRDGVPDHADNCRQTANPVQRDLDEDGVGDACDPDIDGDGLQQIDALGALLDNCPYASNPGQADADLDGVGDACEGDLDGDGVLELFDGLPLDNCPAVANADQADADGDGVGDACDEPARAPMDPAPPREAPLAEQPAEPASLGPYAGFGVAAGLLVVGLALLVALRRR